MRFVGIVRLTVFRSGRLLWVLLLVGLAALPVQPQGYAPKVAAGKMSVPDEFTVSLVASEPAVRQPVAIEFDDRGRLWVIQYLQYPNPAGLKRVKVDRYSRTVYDRVPEPPPRGPKGADRITILEAGADHSPRAKDFISGLNLATGIAFGHGGIFVLQTPYLLFYPDRNGDDIPDADPDVLLSGFGMDDAHSVANSLTWGPDGWLYGCQGSTVTAWIRGIEFQQGVWRYHPITHQFELFCEGGGNSWGLDFDQFGNLLYSTNVGGFVALHGVQGAYYWKQFGKHGELHNPFAYGWLDHIPHRNFRGGHVSVGGIVYQGDSFPERFRGKYIAADLLGHNVYWHDLQANGSTFRSSFGGELLRSNDTWFAPSDVTLGPDGAIYVADWSDQRTAHPDPDADWDRSNGRIYRIAARGTKPYSNGDLTKKSSRELVALLSSRNDWLVRKARRILADRRDPEVILPLRTLVRETPDDHLALEALWALYVSGGFNDTVAAEFLKHRFWAVRGWTVRFLGDENRVSTAIARRLTELAEHEPDVRVRCQLACTAKRLPADAALPLIERLAKRDADASDPFLPNLLWWAFEPWAIAQRQRILDIFAAPAASARPIVRDHLLPRLMRRYAADSSDSGDAACLRLLESSPTGGNYDATLRSLNAGWHDRAGGPSTALGTLFDRFAPSRKKAGRAGTPFIKASDALKSEIIKRWRSDSERTSLLELALRLGHRPAESASLQYAQDVRKSTSQRLEMLALLRETGAASNVPSLLHLAAAEQENERIRSAAIKALEPFDAPEVRKALLDDLPRWHGVIRNAALETLSMRPASALALLKMIDAGKIASQDIPLDLLRPLAQFQNDQIDALVHKHWGNLQPGTPEEKLAEMRRISNDLRAGAGDLRRGHDLFRTHCATCHKLFGEGESVGPDLTAANRKDREYLLASIVDPSAVIRKEYLSYVVQTTDGRTLNGLLVEQSPGRITLLTAKNERIHVNRSNIESLEESRVSLMPENQLKELKPQEVRDLFRHLQSDGPGK